MSIASVWNISLIVLGFGMLIGLHELGHFIAAKWSGIRTNAFAVGMGPVVLAWRGGVGLTIGSTKKKIVDRFGKDASEMNDDELHQHGLSETEYSLRLLPIGGFVSMLGQEDGKPEEVSDDPRSYNKCSIGKRMVVVSAGVVMNLLLAAVLFVGCFQVGVRFEAPIIGQIIPNSPAAEATAQDGTHLQAGDKVIAINEKSAFTFTDIQIAGAMSKPDEKVVLEVERAGINGSLRFTMTPRGVSQSGLLELGLYPASSLTIPEGSSGDEVVAYIEAAYPTFSEIKAGDSLVKIGNNDVSTWSELDSAIENSNGNKLKTTWANDDSIYEIELNPTPSFEQFQPVSSNDQTVFPEQGLLGLCPLPLIKSVVGGSGNRDLLKSGDVILGVADIEFPRQGQMRMHLTNASGNSVELRVLRNGSVVIVEANLSGGKLGVLLTDAWETPIVAQPLQTIVVGGGVVDTAVFGKQIFGGSRLATVDGKKITDWHDFRKAILVENGKVALGMMTPIDDGGYFVYDIELSSDTQQAIGNLGWTNPLLSTFFEPLFVTRSSGGNPLLAIEMGIDETINMVVMTYLTIDRLLRGSVGIDQLRGPVGIVHIGTRIADRGLSYLLFFLAIISVNLAVLNFLPLPIVDGGLFLYLLYEKLRGRPPSIAFQNASAMLGLGLIGVLFVVTFYNDILRLVG